MDRPAQLQSDLCQKKDGAVMKQIFRRQPDRLTVVPRNLLRPAQQGSQRHPILQVAVDRLDDKVLRKGLHFLHIISPFDL